MGNIGTEHAAGRRTDRFAPALAALLLVTAWPGSALAQQEQDDIDEPASPSRMAQVPSVQAPSRPTAELNAALSRLARDPRNVSALVDAGQAALRMGDTQAALGFYTRADQVSPNNGRIKIQIGSALVLANEPADAVKYFDVAESANADLTSFALDRGLAYDLLGDNRQAQGWYQVALSRGVNEEATLRYAISLAISHDLKTAETLLSPLIQKQDRAGWRARTFALAINGDEAQAVSISRAMMPPQLAEAISPYLRYMPRLTRSQQAAAANLGRFPRAADIGHDDSKIVAYAAAHPEIGHGLVPVGKPLGAVASNDDSKVSRAKRRLPGRDNGDAPRAPAVRTTTIDGDLPPPSAAPAAKRGKDRKPDRALSSPSTLALAPTTVAQPAYSPPPPPVVPRPTVLSVLDGPPIKAGAPLRANPAPAPRAAPKSTLTQQTPVIAKLTPGLPPPPAGSAIAAVPPPMVRPAITAVKTPTPAPVLAPSPAIAAATVPAPRPALIASGGPAAALAAPVPATTAPSVATGASAIAPVALPPSTAASASGVAATLAPHPAAGTTFDLARLDASRVTAAPAPTSPATSPAPASAPPAALVPSASPSSVSASVPKAPATDFGSAFGGFTPPPTERQAAVAAVDLSRIKPVRRRPAKPADAAAVIEEPTPTTLKGKAALKARLKARGDRPDGPTASRSEDEDAVTVTRGAKLGPKARKAALEAEAAAQAKKGAKGKRGVPANPSRIWVQLLTAPNRDAFPREWTRITRQAPSIFRGKRGWVTPWGHNYRLLMGPYSSDDDAQDALNDLTKAKVRAFVWTSPAGQAIDHLGDEE